MNCFSFSNGVKKGAPRFIMSASVQSNSTTSTEHDIRRSGSEFSSLSTSEMSIDSISSQKSCNLRVFSLSELKNATRNFSISLMIGEGGFGNVYRGSIKSSENSNTKVEIAVKKLNRKGLQGHKEWLTEVNVLSIVEHPNLVKLLGYCADDDERGIQRLLVYEYMSNKSVQDQLLPRSTTTLSWTMRLRVALDAARGLTYLHEGMNSQIICRDFKTSNILLDEDWNAKLSDFGLARQGPEDGLSHVSTAVAGTLGYSAPEYMLTGHLNDKSDTWSYGIVLLELITGRRPIDKNRPKGEQKLLDWIKPYVSDVKKFPKILDPRLQGDFSLKSAIKLANVARRCLARQPKERPRMSQVLEMVQQISESLESEGMQQPPLRSCSNLQGDAGQSKRVETLRRQGWIQRLIIRTC